MQNENDRVELLKWISANMKKVKSLHKRVYELAETVNNYGSFQDINLFSTASQLANLEDRMDFLNSKIDNAHFVNEGQIKEKGSVQR